MRGGLNPSETRVAVGRVEVPGWMWRSFPPRPKTDRINRGRWVRFPPFGRFPLASGRRALAKETKMKAARLHEFGKPLVLEDVPIPEIQRDEILVKVTACGVCRTDAELIDGYFLRYFDIPTPITPGHEITGVVSAMGKDASEGGLREGDHVVVVPGWGDGTCRHCQIGNTQLCPNVRYPGFGPHGGYAEFLPVPARYLIKVRPALPFEQLAPLTDAGLTPYRAIKKLRDAGALGADRVLGVFGLGGLGGYAVQYARLLGGGIKIVAFDRDPAKLVLAKDYGAYHAIGVPGAS